MRKQKHLLAGFFAGFACLTQAQSAVNQGDFYVAFSIVVTNP